MKLTIFSNLMLVIKCVYFVNIFVSAYLQFVNFASISVKILLTKISKEYRKKKKVCGDLYQVLIHSLEGISAAF